MGKIQNGQCEEKRNRNLMLESRFVLKEIRRPIQGLICIGIKEGVPLVQDAIQIMLYLIKEKCLRNFLFLKSKNKLKLLQKVTQRVRGVHSNLEFKLSSAVHMVLDLEYGGCMSKVVLDSPFMVKESH